MDSILIYGCYNPKAVTHYQFKCFDCDSFVAPSRGYRTTHGSPRYIFLCPNCTHPEFAYHADKILAAHIS